jgi:hypothetical protein
VYAHYVAVVQSSEVNGDFNSLVEAKSPSVMKEVGELLPVTGIELEWKCSNSLVRRIIGKVSMRSSLLVLILNCT